MQAADVKVVLPLYLAIPCHLFYRNPQANILKSEAANDAGAPVIPEFSCRGPSTIVPDIIKVFSFCPSFSVPLFVRKCFH